MILMKPPETHLNKHRVGPGAEVLVVGEIHPVARPRLVFLVPACGGINIQGATTRCAENTYRFSFPDMPGARVMPLKLYTARTTCAMIYTTQYEIPAGR